MSSSVSNSVTTGTKVPIVPPKPTKAADEHNSLCINFL